MKPTRKVKLYTSNYARNGTHPNAISISRTPPKWFQGEHVPEVAPTWDMIYGLKNGDITERKYKERYSTILQSIEIDWEHFVNKCKSPTFFLCYESPKDFCHRHMFASWVETNTGICVQEWKNERERAKEKQDELVNTLLGF